MGRIGVDGFLATVKTSFRGRRRTLLGKHLRLERWLAGDRLPPIIVIDNSVLEVSSHRRVVRLQSCFSNLPFM